MPMNTMLVSSLLRGTERTWLIMAPASHQRRLSMEYTMFAGINDDERHADALARILRGTDARVNLIRFHRTPG